MLIHRSHRSSKSASRNHRRPISGQLNRRPWSRHLGFEVLEERQLLAAIPWYDLTRLADTGALPNNDDRRSVAVDGDTIVVGSSLDDRVAIDAGVAHVYVRNDAGTPNDPGDDSWPLQQVLLPGDLGPHDWFGNSVALTGDTLIVGALHPQGACCPSPGPGDGMGVAYIYKQNASGDWEFQQKLLPSSRGGLNDSFSWQIDIEGDLIAVGANLDDNARGTDAGAVYVFR